MSLPTADEDAVSLTSPPLMDLAIGKGAQGGGAQNHHHRGEAQLCASFGPPSPYPAVSATAKPLQFAAVLSMSATSPRSRSPSPSSARPGTVLDAGYAPPEPLHLRGAECRADLMRLREADDSLLRRPKCSAEMSADLTVLRGEEGDNGLLLRAGEGGGLLPQIAQHPYASPWKENKTAMGATGKESLGVFPVKEIKTVRSSPGQESKTLLGTPGKGKKTGLASPERENAYQAFKGAAAAAAAGPEGSRNEATPKTPERSNRRQGGRGAGGRSVIVAGGRERGAVWEVGGKDGGGDCLHTAAAWGGGWGLGPMPPQGVGGGGRRKFADRWGSEP